MVGLADALPVVGTFIIGPPRRIALVLARRARRIIVKEPVNKKKTKL